MFSSNLSPVTVDSEVFANVTVQSVLNSLHKFSVALFFFVCTNKTSKIKLAC